MCKYLYSAYSFACANIYILRTVLHVQIYSAYSFLCAKTSCVKFGMFKYILQTLFAKPYLNNFDKIFALNIGNKQTKYIIKK